MNLSDLKSDIDFLCGSTSATYPNADKVRNMNVAYHGVAHSIWEADGAWQFDDSNFTDSPVATRTVSNASATYAIPTTALRVEAVEILDSASNWQKLKPMDASDLSISQEEYNNVPGRPVYYDLHGNDIRLFPPPGTGYVTMASGMRIRLSRAPTELVATATTTTPGFAVPFHRILSLAAAIDFTRDNKERELWSQEKRQLEFELKRFYSKRAEEMATQVRPLSRTRARSRYR